MFGEAWIVIEAGQQDFQCEQGVDLRLADFVNYAHTAAADAFEDIELRERGLNFFQRGNSGWIDFAGSAEKHVGGTQPAGCAGGQGAVAGWAVFSSHTII